MAKSELEVIGYEQGMEDMLAYVQKMIKSAMENPALDNIPSKMALQILWGVLKETDLENDLRTS